MSLERKHTDCNWRWGGFTLVINAMRTTVTFSSTVSIPSTLSCSHGIWNRGSRILMQEESVCIVTVALWGAHCASMMTCCPRSSGFFPYCGLEPPAALRSPESLWVPSQTLKSDVSSGDDRRQTSLQILSDVSCSRKYFCQMSLLSKTLVGFLSFFLITLLGFPYNHA